jgi:hypothetical protein
VSEIHAFCKLLAIHPRHGYISNHQIETTRSRFADSQSFVTTICQKGFVPVISQYCADIPQHRWFVVDNKNGHGTTLLYEARAARTIEASSRSFLGMLEISAREQPLNLSPTSQSTGG